MKRMLCTLLVLLCVCSAVLPASAAQTPLQAAAAYVYQTVPAPGTGSIGGDWAVFALARCGAAVPEAYYRSYYAAAEALVKEKNGVLETRKYTEYSRLVLALTAIGKDPRSVAGYDLLQPLYSVNAVLRQGVGGAAWALLALDGGSYPAPEGLRQQYVAEMLSRALPCGGWSLSAQAAAADADLTAMVLCALAPYCDDAAVQAAADAALTELSRQQQPCGGFVSYGTVNAQSTAQVLVALCALDISLTDSRFVKNGNTVEDALLRYQLPNGGFSYLPGGAADQMAAEQALYALAALQRQRTGAAALYEICDPLEIGAAVTPAAGLPGKHAAVQPRAVTAPDRDFTDIAGLPQAEAIRALARRSIVNGRTVDTFAPLDGMKRSEFATIVTQTLGLTPGGSHPFADVAEGSWYAPYVAAAYGFGIINGRSDTVFDPDTPITRQEAVVMVVRAAKLCGMDFDVSDAELQCTAAHFADYRQSAVWARESLAFCYTEGLLDGQDGMIRPGEDMLRCEMAEMLYRLLQQAQLL